MGVRDQQAFFNVHTDKDQALKALANSFQDLARANLVNFKAINLSTYGCIWSNLKFGG